MNAISAKRRRKQARPRPTLTEVARIARVSPATVSRAINNPGVVAEETRKRICAAVAATGYVPNLLAGGLASSRSRLASIIVPALTHSSFNEMIESMTEQLIAARYQVMLSLSGYNEDRLEGILNSVLARRPEAVIITGDIHDPMLRARLMDSGATIIETRHLPREPMGYVVGFSHHEIGASAARLLHEAGRRTPLIISSGTARSMDRQNGFIKTMSRLGVRNVATVTAELPASLTQGRACLAEFLDAGGKADCVFCTTDLQAHGVLIEAQRRGIKVPDDIAVVGFGNMDFSGGTEPALTSVHIDGGKIGRVAAQILLEGAEGREYEPRVTDIGFTIIRRASA
ncbi:MAG: LacI family DNA-binding transcriptional regulator [Pseudomonadota bacterium]